MDDSGLKGIYLARVRRALSSVYETVWRRNLMRSGMVTVALLACVLLGLTVAYRAHLQGNFHKLKLKANIDTERQDAAPPRPGGQEAIVLTRTQVLGDETPEFLSATILPGRGMNVLQISAFMPGRGEVNLLAAPSLDEAAKAMTGKGADANGQASMMAGGAFEAPWAGDIWGTSSAADGSHVTADWQGRTITLPATEHEASNGLILAQGANPAESETLPDGGNATGTFHAGDFGGSWPSKTDLTISVLLTSHAIDLTVVAKNVGDVAEPIGIGWHPRFKIFDGNREQWRLRIPADNRVEVRGRENPQPTGVLLPMAGASDLSASGGVKLGTATLEDCFVGLHQSFLSNGPAAELTDPAAGIGLRLTAMSPTIRAMQVDAPANGDYVSIDPQYNYPDPFGREWEKEPDTGMVVLQPGESTEWKVRLEIYSLTASQPAL